MEFGPWIRRFISQVRRNWFVPYAAMSMRGRVVITFNVHRNGAITDVTVIRPSEIDSFNTAAVNALLASNPTAPLPPVVSPGVTVIEYGYEGQRPYYPYPPPRPHWR